MATIAYNRTNRVLRFDLTDAEADAVERILTAKGPIAFESTLSELIRTHKQQQRDRDVARIRERIETLSEAQRQQILLVIGS